MQMWFAWDVITFLLTLSRVGFTVSFPRTCNIAARLFLLKGSTLIYNMAPVRLIAALLPALVASVHLAELLPRHARGGRMYSNLVAQRDAEMAHARATGALPPTWLPNTTANWKQSSLDNFRPTGRVFNQRFFYDLSFCGSACFTDAPIVFEVGGEWTVTGAPNGTVAEFARQINATMVYLEHRFYGSSLPAPLTDKATLQRYLTVEQAIEDTAAFIDYFESLVSPGLPHRKWVIVGGSYAGALVSWFTVKHGDKLTATWSSSGVVNAILNFTSFDQTVATAVGPLCSSAIRAVTHAFEDAWDNATTFPALLQQFGVAPGFYTKQDFAWMLADSAAMGPQYGHKDKLCSYLVTGNTTYRTGWDALVAFSNWTTANYGPAFGASCYYSTACLSNTTYSNQWNDTTTWVSTHPCFPL